jgi:DNA repair exonuclease SbcCD ATPase subunit
LGIEKQSIEYCQNLSEESHQLQESLVEITQQYDALNKNYTLELGNQIKAVIGQIENLDKTVQKLEENRSYLLMEIDRVVANEREVKRQLSIKEEIWDYKTLIDLVSEERIEDIVSLAPEVEEYANIMLEHILDARFRIQFTGERMTKSGSYRPEFTPQIFCDGKLRKSPSGGEKSLIGEVLRSSIGLVQSKKFASGGSMVRDEVTGFLDSKSVDEYMTILQTTLKMGEFFQIIYITHTDSYEHADAILKMSQDGSITIQ